MSNLLGDRSGTSARARGRLLFVFPWRNPGGAVKSLLHLIRHLSSQYDCALAGPVEGADREIIDKGRTICPFIAFDTREFDDEAGIHLQFSRFIMGCWKTMVLLLRTRPDAVVFFLHHPLAAAAPRFAAALLRRRSIVSFRLVMNGLPVGPRRIRMLNWEKKRGQTWVAVSEDNRQRLCGDMGLDSGEIKLIYNGIGPLAGPGRAQGEDRRELRRRLGLPEDRTIFLFSGRLELRKGCRELALAAALLWKEHPEALCVMLGDGPERDRLAESIQNSGAEPAVLFAGHRSNGAEYLAAADVFVHPSYYEGLSNSMLEAMQMGLPVVAANCSSMPELVTDQVEGLLVPRGDSEALCRAMAKLLGDESLRGRLGQAAAVRARAFPLEATLSAWDKLIEEVLGSRGSGR